MAFVYLWVPSERRAFQAEITAGYVHVSLVSYSCLSNHWYRRFTYGPRLWNTSRVKSPTVAVGARYSLSRMPTARGLSGTNTSSSLGEEGTLSERHFEGSFQHDLTAPRVLASGPPHLASDPTKSEVSSMTSPV